MEGHAQGMEAHQIIYLEGLYIVAAPFRGKREEKKRGGGETDHFGFASSEVAKYTN